MIWIFINSLKDKMREIKHWFRAFVCKDVYYDDPSGGGRKCDRMKPKSSFTPFCRNCEWWNCPKNKKSKGGENAGEKEAGEA